jgi:hypothetical protein
MRWRRREATANDLNSPKEHRREDYFWTIHMKPVMFTLPRFTSAKMFFSCWGSAAALPALANCNGHVDKNIFRDRTRQHPARFARRPQIVRLEW